MGPKVEALATKLGSLHEEVGPGVEVFLQGLQVHAHFAPPHRTALALPLVQEVDVHPEELDQVAAAPNVFPLLVEQLIQEQSALLDGVDVLREGVQLFKDLRGETHLLEEVLDVVDGLGDGPGLFGDLHIDDELDFASSIVFVGDIGMEVFGFRAQLNMRFEASSVN